MKLLNLCFGVILLLCSQQLLAINEIKNIRVWPSPESTRVVFDLSKKIKYHISTLSSPERIIIDLTDARISPKLLDLALRKTGINKIRCAAYSKDKLRVVLEVKQKFKIKDFVLAPNERYGHRLVIDLEKNDKIRQLIPAEPRTKSIVPQKRNFIVAIDAGHGGEDPGAIGPRGTKEKDIALAISKQLQEIINKQPGMKAVLIRNGDYYLGFRERMRRARAKHADLFISIHADAYANTKAAGASVFTLATSKSSSVAARWLAASENRADLVGGVSLNDKSDMVATVLFDLSQTANFAASADAARYVLQSLGQTTALHKPKVESGGFLVLRSPDIPSILVEAGFISNAKMELKLRTKDYQHKIASSIFNGIKQYYNSKPRLVG